MLRFADDCITGPAAVISLKAEIPIKSHPRVNRCPFRITTVVSIRANMANGEFNSEFLRVPFPIRDRARYVATYGNLLNYSPAMALSRVAVASSSINTSHVAL